MKSHVLTTDNGDLLAPTISTDCSTSVAASTSMNSRESELSPLVHERPQVDETHEIITEQGCIQQDEQRPTEAFVDIDDFPSSIGARIRPEYAKERDAERYVKMHKLGEGTYGAVYQCKDRNTGQTVAMKKMRILEDIDEGISASTIREISILYELNHPNIVKLHDVLFCDSRLCLVFEFLEMDLKRYMSEYSPTMDVVKSIIFQILSGLAHCHSRRVLHRDIKPHNILISTESLSVKLADFGLARAICSQASCYTQEVVTQWYRSPEVLLGVSDYTPAVDVWSAGCIMAELLSGGEPIFPGDCEIDQIFKIFQFLGTPSCEDWGEFERCKYFSQHFPIWKGEQFYMRFPELDANGFDLLNALFTYDPKKRISASDALKHPWFSS